MSFSIFLTLFHIIGVALGVGGATVSDVLFFRSLKDRRISPDEFALLHTLGMILWVGLGVLFLSGLGFVLSQLITTGTSSYLVSAWFWAKMTIVAVLVCNAVVMHRYVFPFMKAHVGKRLDYAAVKNHLVLLAGTGVVSICSWYAALTLGVTRGFDFTYGFILTAYLLALAFGVLIAYTLFMLSVFPPPDIDDEPVTTGGRHRPLVVWLLTALVGLTIVTIAWYAAQSVPAAATTLPSVDNLAHL